MGKGAPLVRYLCTTWESVHMFFTEMCPRVVPSTSLLNYFWASLGALGRGEGAPLVRYLCKTQKSLHGRHVWETLRIMGFTSCMFPFLSPWREGIHFPLTLNFSVQNLSFHDLVRNNTFSARNSRNRLICFFYVCFGMHIWSPWRFKHPEMITTSTSTTMTTKKQNENNDNKRRILTFKRTTKTTKVSAPTTAFPS